jgi:hypothetical protein
MSAPAWSIFGWTRNFLESLTVKVKWVSHVI